MSEETQKKQSRRIQRQNTKSFAKYARASNAIPQTQEHVFSEVSPEPVYFPWGVATPRSSSQRSTEPGRLSDAKAPLVYPGKLVASTRTLSDAAALSLKMGSQEPVGDYSSEDDIRSSGIAYVPEHTNTSLDNIESSSSEFQLRNYNMRVPLGLRRIWKEEAVQMLEKQHAASSRPRELVSEDNSFYSHVNEQVDRKSHLKAHITDYFSVSHAKRMHSPAVPMFRPKPGTASTLNIKPMTSSAFSKTEYTKGNGGRTEIANPEFIENNLGLATESPFVDPEVFLWNMKNDESSGQYESPRQNYAYQRALNSMSRSEIAHTADAAFQLVTLTNPEGNLAKVAQIKAIEAEAERQRVLRRRRERLLEVMRSKNEKKLKPLLDSSPNVLSDNKRQENSEKATMDHSSPSDTEDLLRQLIMMQESQSAGKGRVAAESTMHRRNLISSNSCLTCRQLKLSLEELKRKLKKDLPIAPSSPSSSSSSSSPSRPSSLGYQNDKNASPSLPSASFINEASVDAVETSTQSVQTNITLLNLLPQQERSLNLVADFPSDLNCDAEDEVSSKMTTETNVFDESLSAELKLQVKSSDLIRFDYEVERIAKQRTAILLRNVHKEGTFATSNNSSPSQVQEISVDERAVEELRYAEQGCQTEWSELQPTEEQLRMQEAVELFDILKLGKHKKTHDDGHANSFAAKSEQALRQAVKDNIETMQHTVDLVKRLSTFEGSDASSDSSRSHMIEVGKGVLDIALEGVEFITDARFTDFLIPEFISKPGSESGRSLARVEPNHPAIMQFLTDPAHLLNLETSEITASIRSSGFVGHRCNKGQTEEIVKIAAMDSLLERKTIFIGPSQNEADSKPAISAEFKQCQNQSHVFAPLHLHIFEGGKVRSVPFGVLVASQKKMNARGRLSQLYESLGEPQCISTVNASARTNKANLNLETQDGNSSISSDLPLGFTVEDVQHMETIATVLSSRISSICQAIAAAKV